MEPNQNEPRTKHFGTCHCGAVRFAAVIDLSKGGSKCNCSICTKLSSLETIVKPEAFTLLKGEADLSCYTWRSKVSGRYFCKHCGVLCFGKGHLAELGGDFVSVNLNTLDAIDPFTLKVVHWDGRHDNWHAGTRDNPWPIHAS